MINELQSYLDIAMQALEEISDSTITLGDWKGEESAKQEYDFITAKEDIARKALIKIKRARGDFDF